MPPNDGSGQTMQMVRERIDLLRQKLRATPAPVKVTGVIAVLVLVVMTPFLWGRLAYLIVVVPLLYGPVAVVRRSRSVLASVGVGLWGLAIISIAAAKFQQNSFDVVPLLLLPVACRAGGARPAAGPRLRAVPHGGAGAGMVAAPGGPRLVAGPEPAGHHVPHRLGARGDRAWVAPRQGLAGGARGHQATGQGRDDRALRDGRHVRRAHRAPG